MEYLKGYLPAASSDEEDASLPSRARKKRRTINASVEEGADDYSRPGASGLVVKVGLRHERRRGRSRHPESRRTVFAIGSKVPMHIMPTASTHPS